MNAFLLKISSTIPDQREWADINHINGRAVEVTALRINFQMSSRRLLTCLNGIPNMTVVIKIKTTAHEVTGGSWEALRLLSEAVPSAETTHEEVVGVLTQSLCYHNLTSSSAWFGHSPCNLYYRPLRSSPTGAPTST